MKRKTKQENLELCSCVFTGERRSSGIFWFSARGSTWQQLQTTTQHMTAVTHNNTAHDSKQHTTWYSNWQQLQTTTQHMTAVTHNNTARDSSNHNSRAHSTWQHLHITTEHTAHDNTQRSTWQKQDTQHSTQQQHGRHIYTSGTGSTALQLENLSRTHTQTCKHKDKKTHKLANTHTNTYLQTNTHTNL